MSAQPRRLLRGLCPALLLGAVLAGCASGPGATGHSQPTAALPGKPACFFIVNFDGSWTVLNQRELLVYAPSTGPPYLVQLFEPVISLRFTEALGFDAPERTGRICDNTGDYVVIPHYEPHRIPITAVHQVSRAEARQLMLDNGVKPPPQKGGP